MFHITLTEIASFDFDYIRAAVPILGQHLLTFIKYIIRGGHIWNKYGLVLISMLIINYSDLYILCRRKRQPLHG